MNTVYLESVTYFTDTCYDFRHIILCYIPYLGDSATFGLIGIDIIGISNKFIQ